MNTNKPFPTGKVVNRLLGYFLPHKSILIVSCCALCLFSLVDAGMIYFIQPLIDNGLTQSDGAILRIGAAGVIMVFLLRGLFSFVANYTLAYTSNHIVCSLRQQVFLHLQTLPLTYFEKTSTGQLVSKLIYDAEQVARATSDVVMITIRESIIVLVLIAIMINASWQLSLIFLLIGPVIAWLISLASKRFRRVSGAMQSTMGDITKQAEESIRGHKDVLAFSLQKVEETKFQICNNANRVQATKLASIAAMSNPVIQLIASLAIAGILLLASMGSVLDTLTVGAFTTSLVAMGSLLRPLKQLSNINQQLQRGLVASESLFSILDQASENNVGVKPVSAFIDCIRFDDVSFAYDSSRREVLKHVSFAIPCNKTIALVGESGSGKSTITDLLQRFYNPPKGSILLDDNPIENYLLEDYRHLFALVSQQVFLFDASLRDNIAYGCQRDVCCDEINTILQTVQLKAFVESLQNGLDTVVGENGVTLSGGQKQRIALARALLRDAPILVLDEATSALDSVTEMLVYKGISKRRQNSTTIIVTHRLHSIENVDHILAMNNGNLVEQGKHDELVQLNGFYAKLHQQQASFEACA